MSTRYEVRYYVYDYESTPRQQLYTNSYSDLESAKKLFDKLNRLLLTKHAEGDDFPGPRWIEEHCGVSGWLMVVLGVYKITEEKVI